MFSRWPDAEGAGLGNVASLESPRVGMAQGLAGRSRRLPCARGLSVMTLRVFGGIDVGQDRHFPCVLDLEAASLTFPDNPLSAQDTTQWLSERRPSSVAIDSPPRPNEGILRTLLPPGTTSQADRRVGEYRLYIGGWYGTPSRKPSAGEPQAWMASGMDLFATVAAGLNMRVDLGGGGGELLETHPTYAFKALVGHSATLAGNVERIKCDPGNRLRPKKRPAGHRQRIQLLEVALQDFGVKLTDEFRRKWLRIDWVDSTVCALIAAWRELYPNEVVAVGDAREGSIYLRFPQTSFTITLPEGPESCSPRSRARTDDPANACILRLGQNGPAGMDEADTVGCALLALDTEDEVWFPVESAANFDLAGRLIGDGCWFCVAWGNTIQIRARARACQYDHRGHQRYPYPGKLPNPWANDGQVVAESFGWVSLDPDTCSLESLTEFQTCQDNQWVAGFSGGQAALVRGILPDVLQARYPGPVVTA